MGWSNVKDQFEIDDIGARLLANLAKGIYSHEAVLREYVQNAADAYAQLAENGTHVTDPTITIAIDGKSLTIHDAGLGMNSKGIKDAKKIAVSPKAGKGLTGFRGIGIWAGFQACDKLRIVTTRKGDSHRYRLTIDFKDILKHVDDDINIKELLDDRFELQEDAAAASEHYTEVTLIGLHAEYEKLLDPEELKRIIGQNLPCRIDPKFKYKADVETYVHAADGYQEYRLVVGKDEVFKDFSADVIAPRFETLKEGGTEIAKVWWCTGSNSLKPDANQYRGFRLRVRNFAVGRIGIYDDEDGSPYGVYGSQIKMAPRLNWHVGEIHITNDKIVPDTPRTHLEMDALSRTAIEKIRAFYADRIAEAGARSDFKGMERSVYDGEKGLAGGSLTQEKAKDILENLREQEALLLGKAPANPSKKMLRELISEKSLKERRRALIKTLDTKIKQLPKSTTTTGPGPGAGAGTSTNAGTSTQTGPSSGGTNGKTSPPPDIEELLSDLIGVLNDKLDDDELVEQITKEFQKLFSKHQLLAAK